MKGSIGVASSFKFVKLNHVSMELMYVNCDKEIVCALRSLVILIPNN